jgi:polyisoprenoid-binding protein YceI
VTLAPLFVALLGAPALAQTPAADGAAAPSSASGPVTYTLDPVKSWLFVVVYNDPTALAARLGHDHAIRAMDFDGTVVWDPANLGACSVEISFPVTALSPDPPGMRVRAGLDPEGGVEAGALETIKENFLGKSQLDAASFPTISFQSTRCQAADGKVKVTGNLTIRGTTVPVTTLMDVKADGSSFAAAGSFTATHSSFGFRPFTNLAGALRNKDEMKFVVDVVGTPTP